MTTLIWEVWKKHGWASMRASNNITFGVCHIAMLDSGLWTGEYISGPHYWNYTPLTGEYPLEDLKAILETTITLLEAQ